MPRLNRKKLIFLLSAIVLAVFFILREESSIHSGAQLYAFSVGQGDAFFLESRAGIRVLIDGGPSNVVVEKLDRELPFRDRRLDYIVLTHPHADHVTGLISVLDRYQVQTVLMTGVVHTTNEYLSFLEKVKDKRISTLFITTPDDFTDHDVHFEFLWPRESLKGKQINDTGIAAAGGLNDTSIVTKMTVEEIRLLFPGDTSSLVERMLLDTGADITTDVLALGHHGSGTSNSEEWLRAADPKVAVVSAGKGNSYHLPNFRVVKRVERLGIPLFRTDEDGDIVFILENERFSVKTKKGKRLTF